MGKEREVERGSGGRNEGRSGGRREREEWEKEENGEREWREERKGRRERKWRRREMLDRRMTTCRTTLTDFTITDRCV